MAARAAATVLMAVGALAWAQAPPAAPGTVALPTSPQTLATLPAYEGQKVSAIELAGWPGLEAAPILAKLPQKAGQPFSRALVDQSLGAAKAALASRGLQAIQLQVVPEAGGVRVLLILEPAEYFGIYQFPGALQYPYTRLLEAANYQSQQPYTSSAVIRAQAGLVAFFQQEGYFQAAVVPTLDLDAAAGLVNVRFAVAMGPRARYGNIELVGASPAQTARLQAALGSWMARLRRQAIRPGDNYSLARLRSAAQRLQSELNGQQHLAGQVRLADAKYDRSSNRADVTFAVEPGPVVELKVVGAHLWPWTRHSLIPIYQESRVDPELIQEGQDNLANYFSAHGYFGAHVTTTVTAAGHTQVTSETASAAGSPAAEVAAALLPAASAQPAQAESIVYTIAKGPRHKVAGIDFSGNQFFTGSELQAQAAVRAAGFFFFSHGAFNNQLVRTSVNNIEALYQASGYRSVQVTPHTARNGGNVTITFQVDEGPQDFVDSLEFVGNTLSPVVLAPQGLEIGPGAAFSQKLIGQDRAQILSQYLSRGFLNASLRATAQPVAGQPHLLRVVYSITEGPQVRIARVATVGRIHTRQRLVDQATSTLQPERFLTENDMLGAESRLYAPGIFDWAEVDPRRPITSQGQEEAVVKVHEARRNSLVYGFGFELTNRGGSIPSGTVAVPGLPVIGLPDNFTTSQATFYGPDGNIEYTRLNLGGKAETLSVGAFAGRLDQRGSINFSDPNLLWSQFSGNLLLSGEHDSENPIFTSRTGQISFQLERALNPDKTSNLFLRYSYSVTRLTRLLIPALVPARDLDTRLSTLSASFIRDTRDNPLDAHKGLLESYELDYNPQALGSSVSFAKMVTQTAYYRRIPANIIWANSLRAGFDHAFDGSFVPLSQVFFSGGGSTLRGFPLDGAGPQNTIPACGNPSDPATCSLIQVPVGGNALFILNSELRIPTPAVARGLGVALFYDGGNVFSHFGFKNLGASYTNSVGVGLRYLTPVGPIRIDLGHNLDGLPGIKSTQFFITLGQAF